MPSFNILHLIKNIRNLLNNNLEINVTKNNIQDNWHHKNL